MAVKKATPHRNTLKAKKTPAKKVNTVLKKKTRSSKSKKPAARRARNK